MTPDSKHAFHPDPESLNAFAEEALGASEREQIVSHLAQCGRCRDIVFLAQQAAAEVEIEFQPELVAAAAPQLTPIAAKPRLHGWRFAFVPLAALAIPVTVAYMVHLHRVQIASQLAKVESAAPPQTQAAPPPATPPEPAANKAKSPQPKAPMPPSSIAAPPAADKYIIPTSNVPLAAPPPPAASAPQPAPLTSVGAFQDSRQQSAVAMQAESIITTAAARARTNSVAHSQAVGDGLTASIPDQESKLSPRSLGARHATANGAFALYKLAPARLPSGLRAVSTATAEHHTVAVDSAGALFVSDTAAQLWHAVLQQWTGRIVTVRIQAAAVDSGQSAASASVFEIVNDQGQVWTSTDGTVWKAE